MSRPSRADYVLGRVVPSVNCNGTSTGHGTASSPRSKLQDLKQDMA